VRYHTRVIYEWHETTEHIELKHTPMPARIKRLLSHKSRHPSTQPEMEMNTTPSPPKPYETSLSSAGGGRHDGETPLMQKKDNVKYSKNTRHL